MNIYVFDVEDGDGDLIVAGVVRAESDIRAMEMVAFKYPDASVYVSEPQFDFNNIHVTHEFWRKK